MAQNLAQPQPEEPKRQAAPAGQSDHQQNPRFKRLPLSGFEVLLGAVCSIIVVCFAINIIHTQIAITASQRTLQTTQAQLSKVNTKNASANQEISELSSRSRLDAVAAKNGLTLSSQNIRNVSK
ncbi:cell division protein FtsL [Furfurilactobacillus sp. WILCCON 0119]